MTLEESLHTQATTILTLTQLLRQHLDVTSKLIVVNAWASSSIDGYPAKASGAASSGGGTSTLTGVEAAVDTRVFAGTGMGDERVRHADQDPINSLAAEAMRYRRTLLETLDGLANIERRWKRLQTLDTTKELGNASWCAHARSLGLPYDSAWDTHRRTDFDGLWPEAHPVCRWVYDFTRTTGELPTKDQMLDYLQRGTTRVRAALPGRRASNRTTTVQARGSDVEHVADMAIRFQTVRPIT